MSDDVARQLGSDAPEAEQAAGLPPMSAGQLLRRARETAGLHIGAVAVALKVPVKKIEALEEDRIEELPDAVFARALAGSMCRHLKVDPQPILSALPQSAKTHLPDREPVLDPRGFGQSQPSMGNSGAANLFGGLLANPVALASVALVVAALVVFLLPGRDSKTEVAADAAGKSADSIPAAKVPGVLPASGSNPSSVIVGPGGAINSEAARGQPAPISSPMSVDSAAKPGVAMSIAAGGSATPVPAGGTAAPVPAGVAASVAATATNSPAPKPASSGPAASSQATDAGGILLFTAKGPTWIEVTDSQGTVQMRRTLQLGETASAGGSPPLRVVVGRADATTLTVRGKNFDFAPLARDNVARFEIK